MSKLSSQGQHLASLAAVMLWVMALVVPHSSALSTGPGYLGCYTDLVNGVRALPGIVFGASDMTIEKCRDIAGTQGFRYYGVQYSQACFGTNNATSAFMFGKSIGGCNMPCAGNVLQECGGAGANSVYDINIGK
jgi:hypothetical protein